MLSLLKSKLRRIRKNPLISKLSHFKRELSIVVLLTLCITILTATLGSIKVLAVSADGKTQTIKTLNSDIYGTMRNNGINWEWYDIVNVKKDGQTINVSITRSFPINLYIDGGSKIKYVTGGTVADLLSSEEITLAKTDEVSLSLDTPLSDNLEIRVKRIVYKEHTETIKLPFNTKTINVFYSSSAGKMPVDSAGKEGTRYVTKKDKMVDGVVLETNVLKDWVAEKPVEAVKYVALKGPTKVVNGSELKYRRLLTMNATAYTYSSSGNNRTATGAKVAVGGVAINPRLFPDLKLGDKLYIETTDGRFIYGYCTANDIGGMNGVDIFLPSQIDCINFGKRTVKVYVLE